VSSISQIQQIELSALKQILKIADKNGIRIFLRGGSVMGAVKYGGFVPWDDDMDIAMYREDYEKFIKIFSKEWSEDFWMASYRNGDAIHAYFPRILVKESFRREMKLPQNNHLGFSIIDVLPIDRAPSSRIGRWFYKVHIGILRALGAVWTLDIKDTVMIHSPRKQKIIRFIKNLGVQKFYTQNQVYERLDKIYTAREGQKKAWSGTITGSLFDKELFPKAVFGNGVYLQFEDIRVLVPAEFDSYLKQLYGENYANEEPNNKKSHLKSKRIG
jgi:lipopolysaccharide cholinephosphotransferase